MTYLNDSSFKPITCPVCLKEQSTVSDSTNAGVDGVFVIPGREVRLLNSMPTIHNARIVGGFGTILKSAW
jgi:hypothetical protein